MAGPGQRGVWGSRAPPELEGHSLETESLWKLNTQDSQSNGLVQALPAFNLTPPLHMQIRCKCALLLWETCLTFSLAGAHPTGPDTIDIGCPRPASQAQIFGPLSLGQRYKINGLT